MAFNKVILYGRLTADPELKQTQSGKPAVSNGVAINEGRNIGTTFVNFYAYEKNAEFIARYFQKGDGILIEGHLTNNRLERDGKQLSVLGVVCDLVFFAESERSNQNSVTNATQSKFEAQQNADKFQENAPSTYKRPPLYDQILPDDDGLPF